MRLGGWQVGGATLTAGAGVCLAAQYVPSDQPASATLAGRGACRPLVAQQDCLRDLSSPNSAGREMFWWMGPVRISVDGLCCRGGWGRVPGFGQAGCRSTRWRRRTGLG